MQQHETHNLAGRLARLFTDNAPLSTLVLIGVVALGLAAYTITPKQYNPEIERPAFEVVVPYQHASAEEVDRFVTEELTEKVSELEGVEEVTARSVEGGRAVAQVIFEVGYDTQTAKVRLFTQMEEHLDLARGPIQAPQITSIDPDTVPIITVGLTSPSQSVHETRRDAVMLMQELRELPQVANLAVHGGEPPALTVHLDTQAMEARGVTVSDVTHALQAANIYRTTEGLADGERVIGLAVSGRIEEPTDARQVVVAPGVQLSDIADVRGGPSEIDTFVAYRAADASSTQPAVYLSVAKQANANAPTVAGAVRNKLDTLLEQPEFQKLDARLQRDNGAVATEAVQGLGTNLLISIGIVGAVLLVFLSLRPALIVMAAIPMTLLLVFIAGLLFDQTINRITLFALILSLGLLVDSATVVVENIYRRLQEGGGDDRSRTIVSAVHQVGVGLTLSAITSMIVFIPVRFITGMMGPYMGPIAFFVPVALAMSLAVALVVTPFLARVLLRTETSGSSPIRHAFDRLTDAYARLLRVILYSRRLQRRVLAGVFFALVVVLSFPVLQLVHFQMLPKADKDQYYVYLNMREGTDVQATQATARQVADVLSNQPAVSSLQVFVAEPPVVNFSGLFKGMHQRREPHQATLRVNLVDETRRANTSAELVSQARQAVAASGVVPDTALARFVEEPPGPPVRATFVADVRGPERSVREELVGAVQQTLEGVRGVVDIDTSVPAAAPRELVQVDRRKALQHGVTPTQVAETLSVVSGPTEVGQYHLGDAQEYAPIELTVPRQQRDAPADLTGLSIESRSGDRVPLSSVITRERTRTIPPIRSDEGRRMTTVTATTDERSIVYVVIDVLHAMVGYRDAGGQVTDWDLFGLTYTTTSGEQYRIALDGEWRMTLENFRDLGIAMLVAFFFVYSILVAQYRSFLMPALIMVTVFFAFLGIMPGFAILDAIDGTYLTATALIGFIALIGIVVNNAILYLEYFSELRHAGTCDEREALIEAGRVRMRPIVLTSLTTVLASITIAFDPVWSGLAWSVVFGLSLSAMLTLGIFPVLYIWLTGDRDSV